MPAHLRRAALLGLLALAGCQHLAYDHAAYSLHQAPTPIEHGLDAQVLPSGLQLAVFQVPGQRDVTLSLTLGDGSADEPVGQGGVAVVALRAALRSPRLRGGGSAFEALHAAGALVEAYIHPDGSVVSVRCKRAFLPLVLTTLAALLEDPAGGVEASEVARAREEYAWELERAEGSAAAAELEVYRLALAGTPFAREAVTPAGVRALDLEAVRAYLTASWTPPRAILSVASGADAEATARVVTGQLAGRALGDPAHPVAPAPGHGAAPDPVYSGQRDVALVGGPGPRLLLAWRAPGIKLSPAAALAAEDLRGTLAWRARLKDLIGKTGRISTELLVLDRATVLLALVELKRPEDAAAVRTALVEASLRASGLWEQPSAEQLAWRRRSLRLGRERELAWGWPGPVARLVRAVGSADALTWSDVNEEAQGSAAARTWLQRYVDPGPAVVATVAATPERPASADGEVGRRAAEVGAPPAGAWYTAPDPLAAAVPGPEALRRLLAPADLAAARRETLENGLQIVALRRPGAPITALRLVLPGGSIAPIDAPLVDATLRAARLALQAGGCGMAPPALAYSDAVTVGSHSPTAWVPALVESVACWGRELDGDGAGAPSEDRTLSARANHLALTGETLPPEAWPAKARRYLAAIGQPQGAVATLVGDVEPEEALRLMRRAFGRFPARPPALAVPTPARPAARRVVLVDVPGAKQAVAVIVLRLPDGLPVSSAELLVLETLLGDRAERTFGAVGLEVSRGRTSVGRASFLQVSLGGRASLVPGATSEQLRELERLRVRGPAPAELDAARWTTARQHAYWKDSVHGAAIGLGALAHGQPPDAWDRLAGPLTAVDAAGVQRLAEGSAVGAEAIVVHGDAATLLPLLRQEGLQPEVLAPPAKAPAAAPATPAAR